MKIGYGGKLTRSGWTACAAAVASYALNRTIKVALDLNTASELIGKCSVYIYILRAFFVS